MRVRVRDINTGARAALHRRFIDVVTFDLYRREIISVSRNSREYLLPQYGSDGAPSGYRENT